MVQTLREVADQADEAIISMVREYPQKVDGLLTQRGHTEGKAIIVKSTLDPELMSELAKRVEAERI